MRARIPIGRNVALKNRCDDIPRSVAFEHLAVASGLSRVQVRTHRRVRPTAFLIDARADPAEIVRAVALIGGVAPDAHAGRIAHEAVATRGIQRFDRIRRRSIRADILRARIAVVR